MKEYHANSQYKGRYFDFRFCAKGNKEAAEILGCSIYHVSNYFGSNKTDKPYSEVFVTPYCHKAVEDIGHKKEILFEDAKKIIDKVADKVNKKWKNLIHDNRLS